MDNLTHSLVGAVIGQTGLKKKTGLAMPALIIGANLPDVDAACFFWLEGTEHLGFRRGITHGPPAMVLLPLILAALLWGFDRWQANRGKRPEGRLPVHFGWLYGLSLLSCLTHPALDWLNVYGVRLLEPFSPQWFYGDTLFIIDVWLWALLIGSVWWSLRNEKRGGEWKRPARIALTVACLYIFANGLITRDAEHSFAQSAGERDVIVNPVPLAFWEREVLVGGPGYWQQGDYALANEITPTKPLTEVCGNFPGLPDDEWLFRQYSAFVFWSRAPFTEAAEDGSLILRDARFYDPRAVANFSLALPDVECAEPISD